MDQLDGYFLFKWGLKIDEWKPNIEDQNASFWGDRHHFLPRVKIFISAAMISAFLVYKCLAGGIIRIE